MSLSAAADFTMIYFNKFLGVLGIVFIECLISALGLNHDEFLAQLKVPQCQQDCLSKVSFDLISFILCN